MMKGLQRLQRLRADKGGAVAVEFILAFMPMAITFFCFTQVGFLYTAHLVFKHAAVAAGRAAITTVEGCNPGAAKDKRRPSDLRDAATDALGGKGAWQGSFDQMDVQATYGGGDPYGDVTTTVKARYKCRVPMGKNIACPGGFVSMEQQIILPHQGARYDDTCGGK